MTGPFEIVIRIENNTGFPASVTRGEGDPDELAPVLDGLAAALRRRERPRPGQGGIPEGVTALGPVTTETARVQMPVHVEGRVFFAASSASGVAAEGGTVRSGSAGPEVAFAATLGGGHPPSFEIRISGTAAGLGLPHLEAAAAPALPDPSVAQPPSASSWRALLAHHPGQLDGRDMLRRTFEVLWEVAGLRQLDAYVGNPDPNGPATTAFTFVLVRAAATQDGSPAVGAGELNALGLAAWILVLVALLFAAALAWANS